MTPARVKWVIAFAIGAGLLWLGWVVPAFLTTFHVLLSIVLVLIILMQSGSAADLAGAFGGAGSQTAFGPRTAATFLTRATVWCAAMFMLSSLTLSLRPTGGGPAINSVLSRTAASKSQPATPKPKPVIPPVHLPQGTVPILPPNPLKQTPAPPPKH